MSGLLALLLHHVGLVDRGGQLEDLLRPLILDRGQRLRVHLVSSLHSSVYFVLSLASCAFALF